MNKFLVVLILSGLFSCEQEKKPDDHLKQTAALEECKALLAEEENTKQFIETYLRDVNATDWQTRLPKYLLGDPKPFLEEHAAFRESFPNYKSTIKYLTVDGNTGIVWLNVTANYAKTFVFENTNDIYGDNVIRGIKAENQVVSWDETWYFNVSDGKFGKEWDFLKDNYGILKDLKGDEKN